MTNLNALLGSRICHDLINPLGAISNGIELLGLAGMPRSPELALVEESVENATSRLKFLRFAFGDASPDQTVPRGEILQTLQDVARGGRHSYSWDVAGDPPRTDVRTALLSVMCIETSLPVGGDIEIKKQGDSWSVETQHSRLSLDPALWVPLSKGLVPPDLTAARVHFGLLPSMAADADRTLSLTHGSDWVKISF